MLTVTCCYWNNFPSGDAKLGEEYVKRLRNSVARNLSVPHDFVCFSDRTIEGVECRPLDPPSWVGNLPKTYIYSPDNGLRGRVLLFDLDNVIVGSLNDMAAYDGPLCVRGRLTNSKPRPPDGDMISFEAGSEMAARLWRRANSQNILMHSQNGREREFILWAAPHCDQWQDICPGQVVSYRHQCRGRKPERARVVSMHGLPRPHQVTDRFIVENWR